MKGEREAEGELRSRPVLDSVHDGAARRLAAAVLLSAVKDYQAGDLAADWFFEQGKLFCGIAGLNHAAVVERVREWEGCAARPQDVACSDSRRVGTHRFGQRLQGSRQALEHGRRETSGSALCTRRPGTRATSTPL